MNRAYAWLVVNGFIHTEKFEQIFDWLVQAADEQHCTLEIKANTKLLPALEPQLEERRPQFVIFWDKDVRLARLLEKKGLRLYNSAQSIETCDDKSRTYIELCNSGIRMPRTIVAPKTFRPQGYPEFGFLEQVEWTLGYPMVLKECFGSFGQQVYLIRNRMEMEKYLGQIQNRPCLFQEYIACSRGRDIRIQMVGSHAVASMYRFHTSDFRANITGGGRMEPYEPNPRQLEMAQKVMRELKLDFAGIDILFGQNEEPVLCEVNSNAHFVNLYQCTGVNAAEKIVRYCLEDCEKGCYSSAQFG